MQLIILLMCIASFDGSDLELSIVTPDEISLQISHTEYFCLFFLFSILCIVCAYYLTIKTGVHFNLPIWAAGILIGAFYTDLSFVGSALNYISNANLTTVILLYSPTIGFTSNFLSNNYLFYNKRYQLTALTIFGVGISAVLVGIGIKYLTPMGGNLSIIESLLLVSIFCCVEPGAFMGRLNVLGIPKRIYSLIYGESALTPGFSIAFFLLFMEIQASGGYDFVQTFANFTRYVLGALSAGLVIGYATSLLLIRFKRSLIIISLLIFTSIFLVLLSSSKIIGFRISSFIGVGILGQTTGYMLKKHLQPEIIRNIQSILDLVKLLADATLVLIAGTLVGSLYLKDIGRFFFENFVWQSLLVFLIVLLSRVVKLILMKPFLNIL
jgi:NhaP-type Na+/H+ or K+/H+ antiporter